MADPSNLDTEGRTPEERLRLATVQTQIDALNLPDGVTVGPIGFLDADAMVAEIAANDAAVFVKPTAFTFRRLEHNGDVLPVAELADLSWLEDGIRRQRVTCRHYGIGNVLDGVPVPLFGHFRLVVGGKDAPVYVWFDDASEEWIGQAMHRFAIALPPDENRDVAWIATGAMHQFPEGMVVPPKTGRNSLCPCGSGLKAKRCHFG